MFSKQTCKKLTRTGMILMVIGAGLSLLSIVVGVGTNPNLINLSTGSFDGSLFIVTGVVFFLVGTMLLFIFTVEDEKLTDLIKHCEKIQEKGWAEDLKNINSLNKSTSYLQVALDQSSDYLQKTYVDNQIEYVKYEEDEIHMGIRNYLSTLPNDMPTMEKMKSTMSLLNETYDLKPNDEEMCRAIIIDECRREEKI